MRHGKRPLSPERITAHALRERKRRAAIYADPVRHEEWKAANRARAKARAQAEDPSAKERRKAAGRHFYRLRVSTPEGKAAHRDSVRARKYGLKPSYLPVLLSWQEGICPVCLRPGPSYVDHDHATGIVRGVVHPKCNLVVGLVENEPELLEGARSYLRGER